MLPDGGDFSGTLAGTEIGEPRFRRTHAFCRLAPRGIRLTGEWAQPHARVWSSTIRFETTEGRVWFKVNANGTYSIPAGNLFPQGAPKWYSQFSSEAQGLLNAAFKGDMSAQEALDQLADRATELVQSSG